MQTNFLNEDLFAKEPPVNIENFNREEKVEKVAWDEKTKQLMRQILTQKVDLPLSRLRQMIDDGEIDLAPGFQRRLRWSRAQQSRLIESVIMNVPIPPIFLGEDKPGRYVVLDGRQRLTALYQYLGNEFKLSGLDVWSELNGKTFNKLGTIGNPPVDTAITRRFVPAVLILHESVPEVKYEVFDRLNTGGIIAEPMEVRNAIYQGAFTKALHKFTDDSNFRTLWNIPLDNKQRERNGAYRSMADLEMALRFFAFQDYKKFNGSLKNFLNEFLDQRNKAYAKDASLNERDTMLFSQVIKVTLEILGDKAFHRITGVSKRSPQPSAPLADAILYAISKLSNITIDANEIKRIQVGLENLCLKDKVFLDNITVGTNAKSSTQNRIEKLTRLVLNLPEGSPIE